MKNTYYLLAAAIAILLLFIAGGAILENYDVSTLNPGSGWFALVVVTAALIDSINPCALSVLLLTLGFLIGLGAYRQKILQIGFIYIAGVFLVYLFIGLGTIQVLAALNAPNIIAKVGAVVLFVIGGINVINYLSPEFPIKLKIPSFTHHRIARYMGKATAPAAFLLGILVGLFEFPCTGGPYLVILGLLHDNATYLRGLFYLILYNLVFVLPLVIILLAASNRVVLENLRSWQERNRSRVRLISGLAMMVLGAIIFFL